MADYSVPRIYFYDFGDFNEFEDTQIKIFKTYLVVLRVQNYYLFSDWQRFLILYFLYANVVYCRLVV